MCQMSQVSKRRIRPRSNGEYSPKTVQYLCTVYNKVLDVAPWILEARKSIRQSEQNRWAHNALSSIYKVNSRNSPELADILSKLLHYGKRDVLELIMRESHQRTLKQSIQQQILQILSRNCSNPVEAVKLICVANISFNQYRKITQSFGKQWIESKHRYSRKRLTQNFSIPRLFASIPAVRKCYSTIALQYMRCIEHIKGEYIGHEWNVIEILEYIWSFSMLRNMLQDTEELELIVKLDGFPVGGASGFFITLTLGNFGVACKCSVLQFILLSSNMPEKDRELLEFMFETNIQVLKRISQVGEVFLERAQVNFKATLAIGGDDPILRTILGLTRSGDIWYCIYCFGIRSGICHKN